MARCSMAIYWLPILGYITLTFAASLRIDSRSTTTSRSISEQCNEASTTQWLSDPPFENYFYSDCHSASQVVVTSPLSDSNLTLVGPRVLVAWPAGNSGAIAFFAPQNGVNGSLSILLENGTSSYPLASIYQPQAKPKSNPLVGITTLLHLNSSAVLTLALMGSIRTMRDFTEGPSILQPQVQGSIVTRSTNDGHGAVLSRLWLDNVTTTQMTFQPTSDSSSKISIDGEYVQFAAGTYRFNATFDYPQLEPLNGTRLLKGSVSQEDTDRVKSLGFLSYSKGLLAGAWKFLTYFGRDSMIAALLLQPVLADDAIEAVISAVLERLDSTTGAVCHEETIGDYATFLKMQRNITGAEAVKPGCTYQMIDTNYYLPILLDNYFLKTTSGRQRMEIFWSQRSSLDFGNKDLTYRELSEINAAAIMRATEPFTLSRTKPNLIHINEHELVGQWRDTSYGIGGGRIPYDVNTALAPAALRSISALSTAGWFPDFPDFNKSAIIRAKIFEDHTLDFFRVEVPAKQARGFVEEYTKLSGYGFPSRSELVDHDIVFHGLALDGNDDQEIVRVMNTDDCFRLFLLTETTNDSQLTSFLNQTATNLRKPFPVGLMSPIGLFISNPAYGNDPVYVRNFTHSVYHGTVIWSWQMAMMAAGLERQLGRCNSSQQHLTPAFCRDEVVYENVRAAYNELWDVIEKNRGRLEQELWSWVYYDKEGFVARPLSTLPPLAGEPQTEESDIRQLWSLAFIAVKRDKRYRYRYR